MSMRIRQLPADVANQIAAGEVIERPASVVKELLENALDAHANDISVDIYAGGLNQIKISDNGCGIMVEDLPLAIAAHATSKINCLDDLYTIRCMGFRGEALASIASIAHVSIASKPAHQKNAMMLKWSADGMDISPVARADGTTVDVKDIFYNAPVRKKFLKSERTEFQFIDAVMKCFALSAPKITLSLSHNDHLQWRLPGSVDVLSENTRITKLLGRTFIEQSITIHANHSGMRLDGRISQPLLQRSQNDKIWVYLNGRMIKDRLIHHAIKQAYDGLLYPGRYPTCLLYLQMDPSLVDVNVHPTKHEVRFQEPRLVHDFIYSELIAALNQLASDAPFTPMTENALFRRDASSIPIKKMAIEPLTLCKHPSSSMDLSDRYTMVSIHEAVYLVDIFLLEKQYLLDMLEKAPLPLAARPLLVPIRYQLPENAPAITPIIEALAQIGLAVDYDLGKNLLVRSLPILTPHLDLRSFLDTLFSAADLPGLSTLFHYLLSYHRSHAVPLPDEQWQVYMAYLQHIPVEKEPYVRFIRQLTEKICQEIFQ